MALCTCVEVLAQGFHYNSAHGALNLPIKKPPPHFIFGRGFKTLREVLYLGVGLKLFGCLCKLSLLSNLLNTKISFTYLQGFPPKKETLTLNRSFIVNPSGALH